MSENKNLWVLVETKEDGSAVNVGLELLNPGRKMADILGGNLVAVIQMYMQMQYANLLKNIIQTLS